MNTLIKYPGRKCRVADWINQHFPPHRIYVEPYFGAGAVFFSKEPSYIETINDINCEIVNLFAVCRDKPFELARALEMTPFSREEFGNCIRIEGDTVERARRTVVRYNQSYGATTVCQNTWKNSQTRTGPRNPELWRGLPAIVFEICDRLKNAQIENKDALYILERYNTDEALFYLDPPYLQSIRKRNLYKNEATADGHRQLLELVKQTKAKVCLSAYDNELYNSELKDWFTAEKKTTVQGGLHRTEKLYMNYQPDLLSFISEV